MLEASLWHPVALSEHLGSTPVAVTLLAQPLVLWRSADGAVHAWPDRCPHRGARFSLGQVVNDRLECPYHGWQFDGQGQCRHVPALAQFVPPASHCAKPHRAQEAHGLVWVQLAPGPEETPLPAFGGASAAALRQVLCGPYDVATSAPRIVENFIDMAHFGFVHEGWLGTREATDVPDYQVQETPTGLLATVCQAWQPRSNLHAIAPARVEYTYEVTAPYAAVLTKVPEAGSTAVDGWCESIGLFICPVTPESSRVWFCLAVADFESPDEKLQAFQHTIFMQDQPVLESQQPKTLPLDLRAELHTVADKMSSSYRRYLQRSGITFGVC